MKKNLELAEKNLIYLTFWPRLYSHSSRGYIHILAADDFELSIIVHL